MLSQDQIYLLGQLVAGATVHEFRHDDELHDFARGDAYLQKATGECVHLARVELDLIKRHGFGMIDNINPTGEDPIWGLHPRLKAAIEDAIYDIAQTMAMEGQGDA